MADKTDLLIKLIESNGDRQDDGFRTVNNRLERLGGKLDNHESRIVALEKSPSTLKGDFKDWRVVLIAFLTVISGILSLASGGT